MALLPLLGLCLISNARSPTFRWHPSHTLSTTLPCTTACPQLKPQNVLLKTERRDRRGYVAKLADFGLSRIMGAEQTSVETGKHGLGMFGGSGCGRCQAQTAEPSCFTAELT